MLVIDKPAGIAVHKGMGRGDNLEQFFDQLQFGLPKPPSLAHRLDRDTSGCLILGRNKHALTTLGKLFTENKIEKTYLAVVESAPPQPDGIIELPLEKKSQHKARWQMQVAETGGLSAVTHYRLLRQREGKSFLELKPQTGRTHQLRVHCAAIGCPIVGDRIYGSGNEAERLMLHAAGVRVPLYVKKEPITAQAPLPEAMAEWGLGISSSPF